MADLHLVAGRQLKQVLSRVAVGDEHAHDVLVGRVALHLMLMEDRDEGREIALDAQLEDAAGRDP